MALFPAWSIRGVAVGRCIPQVNGFDCHHVVAVSLLNGQVTIAELPIHLAQTLINSLPVQCITGDEAAIKHIYRYSPPTGEELLTKIFAKTIPTVEESDFSAPIEETSELLQRIKKYPPDQIPHDLSYLLQEGQPLSKDQISLIQKFSAARDTLLIWAILDTLRARPDVEAPPVAMNISAWSAHETLNMARGFSNWLTIHQNNLAGIQKLNLSHVHLHTIPEGLFSYLPHLTALDLSSNCLTHLPSNLLCNQQCLKNLNLAHNLLVELPDDIFSSQVHLKRITLCGNHLLELPVNLFKNLGQLKELLLNNNQLSSLPQGVFPASLSKLKCLDLSNNKDLGNLPTGLFAELKSLELLGFSNNKQKALPEELFYNRTRPRFLFIETPMIFLDQVESIHVENHRRRMPPMELSYELTLGESSGPSSTVTIQLETKTITLSKDNITIFHLVSALMPHIPFSGQADQIHSEGRRMGFSPNHESPEIVLNNFLKQNSETV